MKKTPTPNEVKTSRLAANHTQAQAAEVIYKDRMSWVRYESGARKMDKALLELYRIKTGQQL